MGTKALFYTPAAEVVVVGKIQVAEAPENRYDKTLPKSAELKKSFNYDSIFVLIIVFSVLVSLIGISIIVGTCIEVWILNNPKTAANRQNKFGTF